MNVREKVLDENKYISTICKEQLPKVTVVIPVYNSEKYISECLKMITFQKYPNEKLEIIVVDNGSTDASLDIIKLFDVKYILCTKKGPSATRNTGIKEASGEYIVFIDADCIADEYLVYNHIKMHLYFKENNKQVKAIGGGIAGRNANFWAMCDDFCSWYRFHPALKPRMVYKYHPTANLSISKEILDQIGLFDEKVHISEDVLFCSKLINNDYFLYFEPVAKVYHINRTTFREFMMHARQWSQVRQISSNAENKIEKRRKIFLYLIFMNLFTYVIGVSKVIYYGFLSKRLFIIFFIPFISLNKAYFGFHKLKYQKANSTVCK